MAYIGRDIEYGVLEKETLTADSSTVAFDLAYSANANGLIVSVGGIVQEPNVAYTVVGNTLTFSTAPVTGDTVYVVYLGEELMVSIVKPIDYIDYQVGTGDGSDTTPITTLNHSVSLAQDIMVTLNGVRQVPGTDYSVSGTTLTFVTAPAAGVAILVYFLMVQRAEGEILDNSITDAKIVGMGGSKLTGTASNISVTNSNIVSMDASKLTGSLPSAYQPALYPQYQDLSTIALQWASVNNKVSMNLTDDFIDHFQDSTGVDSANSVNALVSSGEYVTSASKLDTATNISPSSNDVDYGFTNGDPWTVSGNSLGDHTIGANIRCVTGSGNSGLSWFFTFDGDVVAEWEMDEFGESDFGFHAISEDANRVNTQWFGANGMTKSWWFFSGAGMARQEVWYGGSELADVGGTGNNVFPDGTIVKFQRINGVFSLFADGVLVHEWTQTDSTSPIRFFTSMGGSASPFNEVFKDLKFTDTSKVQRDGMFDSATTSVTIGDGFSSGRKHTALLFIPTRSGTITNVTINAITINTAYNAHASLYSHDGTNPSSQIGSDSDTVALSGTGDKTFTFTSSTVVKKGTKYWIIVSDEGTTGSVTARQYTTAQLPDGWGAGLSDTIGAITNNWNEGNAMEITIDTSAGEPTPDHDTLLLIQSDTTNGSQTFVDSSQNARTITVAGDSQHSTAQKKFGTSSMYFDGTGDYATAPDHVDWDFSGDFTVDFWVRVSSAFSAQGDMVGIADGGSYASMNFVFQLTASRVPTFYFGGGSVVLEGSAIAIDTWVHFAAVRVGSRFNLYQAGTSTATATSTSTVNAKSIPLTIGRRGSGDNYFKGWLDEVRISNVARWDADFTPPSSAYRTSTKSTVTATGTLLSTTSTADSTVSKATGVMLYDDGIGTNTIGTDLKAYFSADDGSNWTEASSYGTPITFGGTTKAVPLGETTMSNTGTAVKLKAEWANQVATIPATGSTKDITPTGNATFSSSLVKIGNSSIYFDGTGDTLSIPHSTSLSAPSGDFTIEFWFRKDNSSQAGIMSTGNTTTAGQLGWSFLVLSDGRIYFGMRPNGSYQTIQTPANIVVANTWYHMAVVRSGNDFTMYINGVSVGTGTHAGALDDYNTSLLIGNESNGIEPYAGYVDEVRISDTARYTSAFTPSSTAFTNDANTVLLIHSNESSESTTFTDSSSNAHTITANGDTKHIPVITKIGTSSLYCDGVGDLISVADSDDFAFTGDYTIEFWIYYVGTPANGLHICGQGGNAASNFAFMFRTEPNGFFLAGSSNGTTQRLITTTTDMSDAWHHVALVRSGTSQKVYINGTQEGSTLTHSDTIQNVADNWEFGGNSNQSSYINAYFDEIRFSDTARYTANFTPSTTAFTSDANTKLLLHGDSTNPQTQVGQAVGTIFGNYQHSNGSQSAAFDGITIAAPPSIAASSGVGGSAYIGKDWGSGVTKTISGVKIYGHSGEGYAGGGGTSTIKLMGSNTLPSSASDGTELGAFPDIPDSNSTNAQQLMSGITTTTPYRYHWLWNTHTGGDQAFFAEVEFFEGDQIIDSSPVTGKIAQLHGWAVNY